MTLASRLERRMDEAQLSLFDRHPARHRIALASAIESGDPSLEAHLRDIDQAERAAGGRWRLAETLLPDEVVIRDPRLTDMSL